MRKMFVFLGALSLLYFLCISSAEADLLFAGRGMRIEINLTTQTLTFFGEKITQSFHCSTGRAGYRTPVGTFRVYTKERHAVSYKYGNTPMPFTLWFNPVGYGIHASTSVPNHPASHGCVRLKYDDAKWLFSRVSVGTPVVIHY